MTNSFVALFESRVAESSTMPALRRRTDDEWQTLSWKEWWEISERIAAGLIDLGVQRGDRVALISETRAEWLFADIAIMMAGAVTVPVFPSFGTPLVEHVLRDSGARAAIVENPVQLQKVIAAVGALAVADFGPLVFIDDASVIPQRGRAGSSDLYPDDLPGAEDAVSLESLAAIGRRRLSEHNRLVADRRRSIEPHDMATIVYTSGTTALPKGAVLTHRNLAAEIEALTKLEILGPEDVQYLFLPLAHIFARVLSGLSVGFGCETVVCERLDFLLRDLSEAKPTFMAGVPAVFERLRAHIESEATDAGGLRERLFEMAVRAGREVDRSERHGVPAGVLERAGHRVLGELVGGRWRAAFGGRMRFMFSGGAPLPAETAEFFGALGVPILEGYGLTETTAVACVNLPDDSCPGAVGRAIPGVDVTIDEDGEVLVRGPTVFAGYIDHGVAQPALDEEGWFHTGDIGEFDRDGYLTITGRKKELIITAGGKNVAPVPIEQLLGAIGLVQHAMVHADRRPFLVALLSLDPDAVEDWRRRVSASGATGSDEALRAVLKEEVARVNEQLAGGAVVRDFAIVPKPFTEENGCLTPTGKLRRSAVAEQNAELIDALYRAHGR